MGSRGKGGMPIPVEECCLCDPALRDASIPFVLLLVRLFMFGQKCFVHTAFIRNKVDFLTEGGVLYLNCDDKYAKSVLS